MLIIRMLWVYLKFYRRKRVKFSQKKGLFRKKPLKKTLLLIVDYSISATLFAANIFNQSLRLELSENPIDRGLGDSTIFFDGSGGTSGVIGNEIQNNTLQLVGLIDTDHPFFRFRLTIVRRSSFWGLFLPRILKNKFTSPVFIVLGKGQKNIPG